MGILPTLFFVGMAHSTSDSRSKTMTNDIVALIDFYEREKAIDRARVIAALEYAFCAAYRKMVPGADKIANLRAEIDLKKGTTKIFASLLVVPDEEYADKFNEVPLSTAVKKNPEVLVEERLDFNVTPKDFGRIAVQTAKQTMQQRLRMAEKEMIFEEFKDRCGEIVSGVVNRFERSDVYIDLGKFEAIMPSRERVQTEEYNINDRIRAYVVAVDNEGRGPEVILSRSHPHFVRRLFEAEVSEIADRTVEIRAIAREAGHRTKIAVWSKDDKVDPVGACVGLRGARVKNIVRELNNEKVDIIRWSEDPRDIVEEALKPAVIRSITVDEEKRIIHVTVSEEDLSKAIGRRGQNARLTSRLIDWDVQVRRDESQQKMFDDRINNAAHNLGTSLGLNDDLAELLFRSGGISIDLVVEMPADYIADSLGIPQHEADDILSKAQALLG